MKIQISSYSSQVPLNAEMFFLNAHIPNLIKNGLPVAQFGLRWFQNRYLKIDFLPNYNTFSLLYKCDKIERKTVAKYI